MEILFSFLICLLATTIGGISGVGGGVIIKPVLDATSGMPVATVSFLSGCTVLAMTITSMLRSRGGEVKVEPRRGTLLAIGAAVGGVVGKELFELVRASGGAAVSLAEGLGACTGVEWLDLGMAEALWSFRADRLGPLIVAMDAEGNSLYEQVRGSLVRGARSRPLPRTG